MLIPPALGQDSVVRVVAPAGPFDARLVYRGMGWLAGRYRLRFDRGIFERRGYLAGSDERRRAELVQALEEPDVAAIFCARGGYGVSRFAHQIPWETLRRNPRWIVGFSDNTALHVEASKVGVASLHGCHVTALGRADQRTRRGLLEVLESPESPRRFASLAPLIEGRGEGTLFAGNLALLHACAAAGRLRLPEPCVLLLEDIGERPYRVDRMITTLEVGGHLDAVTAVVLGDFSQCDPGPDGVTVERLMREQLARRRIPVAAGAPVGHGLINDPVIVGADAMLTVDGDAARLDMHVRRR